VFTDTVDVSGAATLNSTLDVDGATTLNSTLDVDGNISSGTGAVTVTDSVNITGAVDCDSTLNVDGAVTVDSLVVDNGSITLENSETISNSTDGDVFVNGELLYRTNVISQSADYTVQAADSGSLIITTGAGEATTHTLPTAAAGLSYCWYVGEAYSLTLDAAAGDTILHLTDGAGQRAQNATEGDSVCLYGQTSLWIPMHEVGTWEDIN